MKYYHATVNKTLTDGTHRFTRIYFLIKRHRANTYDPWTYTVKIGYSESIEDVNNKPHVFLFDGDWCGAINHAFESELGCLNDIKLEHITEVKL